MEVNGSGFIYFPESDGQIHIYVPAKEIHLGREFDARGLNVIFIYISSLLRNSQCNDTALLCTYFIMLICYDICKHSTTY